MAETWGGPGRKLETSLKVDLSPEYPVKRPGGGGCQRFVNVRIDGKIKNSKMFHHDLLLFCCLIIIYDMRNGLSSIIFIFFHFFSINLANQPLETDGQKDGHRSA